jgi:hypothetical protein
MVTSKPDTSDRTNSRDLACGRRPAVTQADIAAPNPSLQARSDRPTCRDPYAYSRVLLNTSYASGSCENDVLCNDNRRTFQSPRSDDQSVYYLGERANNKEQVTPYNVAVFGCRPNGQPLATIIEKGSHSTLHSHPSLVSITCRYSLPLPGNSAAVPVLDTQRHTHKNSKTADGNLLQSIQEHTNQDQNDDEEMDDPARLGVGPIMPCPEPNITVPVTAGAHIGHSSDASQLQRVHNNNEGKGLKGLLRDVIRHVRGASRQGESPSSLSLSLLADGPYEQADTARVPMPEAEGDNGNKSQTHEKEMVKCLRPADTGCPQLPPNELSEDWAGDCERSFCNTESSGSELPTIRHVPPDHFESSDDPPLRDASVHQLPSCSAQSDEQPAPKSELLNREDNRVYSSTPAFSERSRDDYSGRYTFDGTPIYRSNAPSLYELDRAREFSFSGTASTSYSSTILGIDLDLHQDIPLAIRRSVTPVWVCAPVPNHPQENSEAGMPSSGQFPPRSVTSSALPILLPLAAASGIVQPNHAVPYVSFYSPSGNLIQAEPSSSSSSPTTSYYRKALSLSEQTARPAAVPLTTPPHSSIAVPTYLKQKQQHNHNLHHHTRSHIIPQHAIARSIRGCDGIILRTNSFTPRSGVPVRQSPSLPSHPKSQPFGLKPRPNHLPPLSGNSSPRSRFRAVAFCTSQTTARVQKGKKKPEMGNQAVAYSSSSSKKSRLRRGGANTTPGTGLAPLAAHTMRVCFCQPRDGDGDAVPRLHHAGDDAAGCLGEACHDHALASSPDDGGLEAARVKVLDLGTKA